LEAINPAMIIKTAAICINGEMVLFFMSSMFNLRKVN
jgi:hypothetical protein